MSLADGRDGGLSVPTLAPMLAAVQGALDPALVTPDAAARLRDVMSRLPDALTHLFYLETRLDRDPAVDLVVQVNAEARQSLLAGDEGVPGSRDAWHGNTPSWERVRALAKAWDTAGTPLAVALHHLWLEFDVGAMPRGGRLVPGVFACFGEMRRPDYTPALWHRYSLLALRPLLNGEPSAPLRRNLSRCFDALPGEAYLPYVGVMLGREGESVRLCLVGVAADALPGYLAAIGWESHDDQIPALVSELSGAQPEGPLRGAGMIHLDVSPFGVWRVGLEFACDRRMQLHGQLREAPMLDALVRLRLASKARADALLRWPGTSAVRVPAAHRQRVIIRRLNHVKLVFRRDAPPQAKAYLAARHMPRAALHAQTTPPSSDAELQVGDASCT